jgi:hypothetical protein
MMHERLCARGAGGPCACRTSTCSAAGRRSFCSGQPRAERECPGPTLTPCLPVHACAAASPPVPDPCPTRIVRAVPRRHAGGRPRAAQDCARRRDQAEGGGAQEGRLRAQGDAAADGGLGGDGRCLRGGGPGRGACPSARWLLSALRSEALSLAHVPLPPEAHGCCSPSAQTSSLGARRYAERARRGDMRVPLRAEARGCGWRQERAERVGGGAASVRWAVALRPCAQRETEAQAHCRLGSARHNRQCRHASYRIPRWPVRSPCPSRPRAPPPAPPLPNPSAHSPVPFLCACPVRSAPALGPSHPRQRWSRPCSSRAGCRRRSRA